nr:MAG TPA: hypothetical protein [Caudoviricetes sp.]
MKMNNSDFVWVLTDGETNEYDIFKSEDGAMYEALKAIRASYGGIIPKDVLEDFCGSSNECDFFIYLCEHPGRLHNFGLDVECRVVRD